MDAGVSNAGPLVEMNVPFCSKMCRCGNNQILAIIGRGWVSANDKSASDGGRHAVSASRARRIKSESASLAP